jgi:hypothetical protein
MRVFADDLEKSGTCSVDNAGNFPAAGLRAMADAFEAFRGIVAANTATVFPASSSTVGGELGSGDVYDDYDSKLAAWRTALYVASLTVRTDMEIVSTRRTKCSPAGTVAAEDRRIIGYL